MEGIYLYMCSNIQTTPAPPAPPYMHKHHTPSAGAVFIVHACASPLPSIKGNTSSPYLVFKAPWALQHCGARLQAGWRWCCWGGGQLWAEFMGHFCADHFSAATPPPNPPHPPRPPARITHSDILEIKSRPNPICTLCSGLTQHYINGLVGLTWLRKKKKKKDKRTETCYMSSMGTQVALLRRP